MDLAAEVRRGNIRAIARAISLIEDLEPEAEALVDALYPYTGGSLVLGVTGSPGAGKSTLVDRLISLERRRGSKVAVIAVDPSSPFSGGAILGDRLRMQTHATADPGVFIRSMASRGFLGGVTATTADVIKVLDAAGYRSIFIETIGVGQTEVKIVELSDLVLLVLMPGAGDEIQAMKAGVMEIADCFVMNKADQEGVERAKKQLQSILDLKEFGEGDWRPPIVSTIAPTGEGLEELVEVVDRHFQHLVDTKRMGKFRLAKSRADFMAVLEETLSRYVLEDLLSDGDLESLVESIAQRKTDPYTAAEEILARLRR